jgi:hypothetical protein
MSFDPVHKVIPAFVVGEINQENADRLIAQTQAVNDGSLHVFFSDQRPQYREAILKAFGQWMQPERQGQRGRRPKPRLVPPPDLLYAQVVKHRRKGRVVKVTTEVVFGTPEALGAYLKRSPASRRVNTAFVERQNNTMRQHNRRFTRKTLGFSKKRYWMERQLHLCVGYYHFCLPHSGLREEIDPPLPTKGNGSPKKWQEVTPMMAAGVTDHVWTLQELLMYRVPPRAPENIVSIDEGHQTFVRSGQNLHTQPFLQLLIDRLLLCDIALESPSDHYVMHVIQTVFFCDLIDFSPELLADLHVEPASDLREMLPHIMAQKRSFRTDVLEVIALPVLQGAWSTGSDRFGQPADIARAVELPAVEGDVQHPFFRGSHFRPLLRGEETARDTDGRLSDRHPPSPISIILRFTKSRFVR